MKTLSGLALVLLLVAGLLALATRYFSPPWLGAWLVPIVLLLVGSAALLEGIETVRGGAVSFRHSSEQYTGLPARLWGLWMIVTGLGLLAGLYGLIRILAGEASPGSGVRWPVQDFMFRVQGALMAVLALLLLIVGAVSIIAPDFVAALIGRQAPVDSTDSLILYWSHPTAKGGDHEMPGLQARYAGRHQPDR